MHWLTSMLIITRLAMLESSAVTMHIPLQSHMFSYSVYTKYSSCSKHNQKFIQNILDVPLPKGTTVYNYVKGLH